MTRIEINPKILCGKPVIKGTRIPVYLILELLAAEYDFERINGSLSRPEERGHRRGDRVRFGSR